MVLPKYRYCYEHLGIVENEFCPVLVAFSNYQPKINPDEVQAVRWVSWLEFLVEISLPNKYSEWCQEEALLLSKNKLFNKLFNDQTNKNSR
jgi:isopentenyl-diphosphate delta-isomerase